MDETIILEPFDEEQLKNKREMKKIALIYKKIREIHIEISNNADGPEDKRIPVCMDNLLV